MSHLSKRKHRGPTAPQPETQRKFRIALGVNRLFVHGYHRLRVSTPSTLPRTGPAILVSNHISALDPLLLQAASRRVVIWMMAKEFYDIPVLGWFFRTIETIPVDRGGRDIAATRAALRTLEQGRILGIFPEGRIAKTRDLLPFQTGVAMMAIRAEVPVCPAYLDGSTRGTEMLPAVVMPNEVRVRFGPPIDLTSGRKGKPDLDESAETIRQGVEKLSLYKDLR